MSFNDPLILHRTVLRHVCNNAFITTGWNITLIVQA